MFGLKSVNRSFKRVVQASLHKMFCDLLIFIMTVKGESRLLLGRIHVLFCFFAQIMLKRHQLVELPKLLFHAFFKKFYKLNLLLGL